MLSTDFSDKFVQGHLEIYRIGYYPVGDRMKIWESSPITVQEHKLFNSVGMIGPGWPISVNNLPTKTWQPGYYTMGFVNLAGKQDADIAYYRGDVHPTQWRYFGATEYQHLSSPQTFHSRRIPIGHFP